MKWRQNVFVIRLICNIYISAPGQLTQGIVRKKESLMKSESADRVFYKGSGAQSS